MKSIPSQPLHVLRVAIVLAFGCFASACQRTIEDPKEYLEKSGRKEGGLVLNRPLDGVVYSIRHRPTDYFLARNAIAESSRPSIRPDQEGAEWDKSFFFVFSVRLDGANQKKDPGLAQKIEAQLRALQMTQGNLADGIYLLSRKGDTLGCGLAQIQPDWINHQGFDILLGFGRRPGTESIRQVSEIRLNGMGLPLDPVRFDLESIRPKYRFASRAEVKNAS